MMYKEVIREEKQSVQPYVVNELGPAVNVIKHPVRLLVSGRSTMGKTTLAVAIICNNLMKDVNRCFVVCPTFWSQPAFAPLRRIPNAFNHRNVFTIANEDVFNYIWQMIMQKPANTLIIVDDCAAEASTNKGNKGAFARLCISCNHHQTSLIGIFQRMTSASNQLRDNAEGLISFIPSNIDYRDIIYKEFNPCPAEVKSFKTVLAALNEAWTTSRFCFIWREAFTGKIYYYSGFKKLIKFRTSEGDNDIRRKGGNENNANLSKVIANTSFN